MSGGVGQPPAPGEGSGVRERFTSGLGALLTMIGVAAGLGNIWRFPYMVGKFGGAAFVLFYLLAVVLVGIPALVAEWTLGRHTRRGTVGAFERGGLPGGRYVGWFFFVVMTAGVAYYTNVLGWVLYHAAGELARTAGTGWNAAAILPPDAGFVPTSFLLQLACTTLVIGSCVVVLRRGLRAGIEPASRVILPVLLGILGILIVRAVTLPGAGAGLEWYIGKFRLADLDARVMVAAMGQAVFSLSLGGTFMVVYGSYLRDETDLRWGAVGTALGDTTVGLLAGFAIFPAVFALGLEPNSGPGLLFDTLPRVFAGLPAGSLFGLLFFVGLFGAAYLSDVAGFEVLVAGLTDNTNLDRRQAVWLMAGIAFVFAIPPMLNMRVFVPWDLTFGSGMQTVGTFAAAITVGWAVHRSAALGQLAAQTGSLPSFALYYWIRYFIPAAVVTVGIWWLLTDVLGVIGGV